MLVKMGVDYSRLKDPIRSKLRIIDNIFGRNGNEAVLTATFGGLHSPSSFHYVDLAADFRLGIHNDVILKELRQHLGKDYDVVLETTHFHIEYDPK